MKSDAVVLLDALWLVARDQVEEFMVMEEHPDIRRILLETDPAGLSPGWLPCVEKAQHLCRVVESRLAADAALMEFAK